MSYLGLTTCSSTFSASDVTAGEFDRTSPCPWAWEHEHLKELIQRGKWRTTLLATACLRKSSPYLRHPLWQIRGYATGCIRSYLDSKTASTIAASIVHSKLDYCNSL